ncbi:RHS repeat-associated core domain-containing protein [Kitasatospora sp. NPDC058397]|uniref:RHS repeat-associated core domain-containing protein n=1 Tax=unclassified Kitasatospora TaxID=2633591 RepID=UPI003665799F
MAGAYAYTPYGAVSSHTGSASTALRYAGQYSDDESGLVYLRARSYDPATAQFLSVDPVVEQTLSAYGYANADPLNQTDPAGLWGWSSVKKFAHDHSDVISHINSVATAVWAVSGTVALGCAFVGALPCAAVAGGISGAAWLVTTVTQVGLVADKCSSGTSAWDCGEAAGYLTADVAASPLGLKGLGALRGVLPARTDKSLDVWRKICEG